VQLAEAASASLTKQLKPPLSPALERMNGVLSTCTSSEKAARPFVCVGRMGVTFAPCLCVLHLFYEANRLVSTRVDGALLSPLSIDSTDRG